MRVLHIGKFFPPSPGGIENFTGDLLPALAKLGVETFALVHQDRCCAGGNQDEHSTNVTVQRVHCYGRLFYAPISPGFPRALLNAMRDFKPDIIHFHLPNTSAFWALGLPAMKKVPWIIHWHADVVSSRLDCRLALAYHLYRPFEQRLLARAKTVICTSKRYLESSESLSPWRKKCAIVPLGIDLTRYQIGRDQNPSSLHFPPRANESLRKFLAIGRLTYYKGHEILIKAAAEVQDVQIIIVGRGEQRQKLEKMIRTLKVSDRVLLCDYLPDSDLHRLIEKAYCVCLPSIERTEAFGLVLLEAMHFKKPVIAGDVPGSGIGWVVDNKITGLLCPPGDHKALALAIRRMSDNPDLAEKMGSAGNEKLHQHFQISNIAQQIKNIYSTLT